jgi:hypothetical protein
LSNSIQTLEPVLPLNSKRSARASFASHEPVLAARRRNAVNGIFTVCHTLLGVNGAA